MKMNKMMRVASILLIATLLTTSIISGTFAKYVTRGEVADQARVAKFGVVVTGSGDLFAENYWSVAYDNVPSDLTGVAPNADGAEFALLTVESSNNEKLVAPGSKNDNGLNLAITGAPEVDVKITLSIADGFQDIFLASGVQYPDATNSGNRDDGLFSFFGGDNGQKIDYHPVLFTLKTGDGAVVPGCDGVTLEDMQAALKDYSVYVDANTDLSLPQYSYTLSWEWAFEGPYNYTSTVRNNAISMNALKVDQADTLLGDLMAARMAADLVELSNLPEAVRNVDSANYSLDISVSLSLTVTQVD